MGWTGNFFLIWGLWLVGNKVRKAFILSFVGEVIWTIHALNQRQFDLAFICFIFAILAVRSWFKWGNQSILKQVS